VLIYLCTEVGFAKPGSLKSIADNKTSKTACGFTPQKFNDMPLGLAVVSDEKQ
jgi:hypothetical protein